MNRRAMKKTAWLFTALALVFLGGCGDDNATAPLDPFQPQVANVPDNFQLQATDVTDVGTTLHYSWQNSGTQAVVDHSTTVAAGTASLIIRDAGGAMVYSHGLVPSLNEDTASGSTGTWTITVTLAQYSGTLNFRVQKK